MRVWATQLLGVGDPASTRVVYGVVSLLAVLGVAFLVAAVWLARQTRPDLELLAPLERMSSRSWRRLAPAERKRALDAERPPGAEPLLPARRPPEREAEFGSRPPMADVADLRTEAADDPLVIDTTLPAPEGEAASGVEPPENQPAEDELTDDDSTAELDDPDPTMIDTPLGDGDSADAGADDDSDDERSPTGKTTGSGAEALR